MRERRSSASQAPRGCGGKRALRQRNFEERNSRVVLNFAGNGTQPAIDGAVSKC